MLQVLLLVALTGAGLVTLITGKLAASKNRVVPAHIARPIGAVFLIAALLALLPRQLFAGLGELNASLAPFVLSIGTSAIALIAGLAMSKTASEDKPY